MRVAIDPVPLVLGIYAHVGKLLARAEQRHEDVDATALGRRFARGRAEAADKEVQRLVRTLHADVKTADKLLKKTSDAWKISRETDLVNLVVQPRGQGEDPRAYILLQQDEVKTLLDSIRNAAEGAGETEDVLEEIAAARDALTGKANDYVTFGFDPWGD